MSHAAAPLQWAHGRIQSGGGGGGGGGQGAKITSGYIDFQKTSGTDPLVKPLDQNNWCSRAL